MSSYRRPLALRALLAILASTTACASKAPAPGPVMPEFVVPNSPTSPFSPVVKVGNMLYVSGQLGIGAGQQRGIGPETTAAMNRISQLLKQAGSSMDRVVKCTIMLADMGEWAAMNEAYLAFFPGTRPARSSFGTSGLAYGGRVEIECMATVN